jgi:fructoselysine 6-kinase
VPSVAVDTLGAGDAFIGRLLAGLVRAEPLPVSLESAARVAAEAVQIRGAFGYPHSLPSGFPRVPTAAVAPAPSVRQ